MLSGCGVTSYGFMPEISVIRRGGKLIHAVICSNRACFLSFLCCYSFHLGHCYHRAAGAKRFASAGLAAEAGVGAQVADITARAMNGELEFEGALKERVALLKGLPVSIIDKVLSERITYMPGGRTLVATMKANGAFAMLVSGGFTAFAARVADALGMDAHRANTLHVDGDVLAGTVAEPILGRDAKVESLKDRAAQLGISEADVLAVGDGANDLGMLSLAGTGVALHAKPAVQAQCDLRINHGDLTALLFLQGYARDAFVTD